MNTKELSVSSSNDKSILKNKFFFYFSRIFSSLFLLAVFFLPIGMEDLNLADIGKTSDIIYCFSLPFVSNQLLQESILRYFFLSIYFLPFSAIFSLLLFFTKYKLKTTLYIFNIISLSIYLLCSISSVLIFSNCINWFKQLPFYIYIIFSITLILHIFLTIIGVLKIKEKNHLYSNYKNEIQKSSRTKNSIKTKLTVTIIISIVILLVCLISLILKNYKMMYTQAISDIGRAKAEQTANVYDSADGKYEKIKTYFDQQTNSNKYSDSPFDRIDIIISSESSQIYLENLDLQKELPAFDTLAYTTAKTQDIPKDEKKLSDEQAKEYLRKFQSGAYKKIPVYNKNYNTYKYVYPVSFSKKSGSKLVGFSIVTYKQDILMKSYFHTKVFAIILGFLFLYVSSIISLFIADYITNPLLYLRANVKKTTDALSMLLERNSNLTAQNINFEENINTNDEIKELSQDISDFVSLIKGMIPYISFSTLQNADNNKIITSTKRELCFLFTDIRDFTSLCEDKQPKEIVEILNHYLEIETNIIKKNNGDIDKFVGDAMMAFFSGPRKEINACKAAMEIRSAMREEQKNALSDGTDIISIGIGINTGKVIFGSVGSSSRMDFTSIGDTVNLASRLESANKIYGSKSIISEEVYIKLKNTFICRELDFITVKGKSEPVKIYEILQKETASSDKIIDIKTLFEKGLYYYRKQEWQKAEEYFSICASKYQDLPSIVFLERIAHFKTNPLPKDWDGVFVAKVK